MFIRTLEPLTNYEITKLAKELKIKNFRGVFMRDTLPGKVNDVECGVVNVDNSRNNGTQWVCYHKNNEKCYYFDSFGLSLSYHCDFPDIQFRFFPNHCPRS